MNHGMHYRISVQVLENGFTVDVPDMAAMQKKLAEAKKKGDMSPYLGDMMKSYAAKNVKEVLKFVSTALGQIPDAEYDHAFDEAAGKK